MLPEQRGLLSSWFSRLTSRGGPKASARKRKQLRTTCMESLEERRVLTTLYVDFGDLMPTLSQAESAWATYGITPPNNQASWIQGPQFNIGGNPQITYTSLRNVLNDPANAAIVNTFDPGPDPATDPYQFNAGAEPPIDKISAIELSITEMLTRQFAPFNISVVAASARNMADVQASLWANNRVDNPYLIPAHAAQTTPPNPDTFYNPTNGNPAGHTPPGFDPLSMLTANGITFDASGSSEDVYVFVGGWTLPGGQQVAVVNGNKLGFSNNIGDPNDVLGEYPSFADQYDPIYGRRGHGNAADANVHYLRRQWRGRGG